MNRLFQIVVLCVPLCLCAVDTPPPDYTKDWHQIRGQSAKDLSTAYKSNFDAGADKVKREDLGDISVGALREWLSIRERNGVKAPLNRDGTFDKSITSRLQKIVDLSAINEGRAELDALLLLELAQENVFADQFKAKEFEDDDDTIGMHYRWSALKKYDVNANEGTKVSKHIDLGYYHGPDKQMYAPLDKVGSEKLLSDVITPYRQVMAYYNNEILKDVKNNLKESSTKFKNKLINGKYQYPWELVINSKLFSHDLISPSTWQLLFLHPEVGFNLNSDSIGFDFDNDSEEANPNPAFFLHGLGIVKYNSSFTWHIGASLSAVVAEDLGVGYGPALHFGHKSLRKNNIPNLTIGAYRMEDLDDDVYIGISFNFFKKVIAKED